MTEDLRPDPDQLLATVTRESQRAHRGRLRIFFGATAGVGKTYSMLEAARGARAAGVDLVVGYVEPHGREETERLLEGLEVLPSLSVRYRGITRQEFDLDAALKRRAAVTLVDELAHSNVLQGSPSPRHAKRWQDVEEMLDAGLDVWTTLNVQHLESLNDVVAGITGVRQQETVPDSIVENADEIELIDLPPDELLARLKSGKVYVPEQVGAALERYFRKPNLIALRELALRQTADRVDAAARGYPSGDSGSRPWLARDRFIVGVAPDAQCEQLVRFGKRFAEALDAEWIVVSVETPELLRLGEAQRDRRIAVLRLAESLGAETVTLDGPTAAEALLEYARTRKVTRIVVGRPQPGGLRRLWRRSTADVLLRTASDIDVSIIAPRHERNTLSTPRSAKAGPASVHWDRYGYSALITVVCTGVAALMDPHFEDVNLVMVYLLGAAIAGLRFGRGPAIMTAVLNIGCFNFFFIEPRLTFAVSEAEYLVTFAVMLIVALTIASLMANVRMQTRVAGARERRTALLYGMSRDLAATRGTENMVGIALRHVSEGFACRTAIFLSSPDGRLRPASEVPPESDDPWADLSIAQWVQDHSRPAGLGADALPGSPALYLPLAGSSGSLGVMTVLPSNPRRILLPEQRHLLEAFAGQLALALERANLAAAAEASRIAAETESVRNTLLASISHDLRTPLAVISGASAALAERTSSLSTEESLGLVRSIASRAQEMSDLVSNVLDLIRFEAEGVPLWREWESLEDCVGAALHKVEPRLAAHVVNVSLAEDLPAVWVDAALLTQAIVNVLENAGKHTPEGTRISITAAVQDDLLVVTIEDDGPGLPDGDPEALFAKFRRGRDEGDVPGAGLGLAVCRVIIEAHGGTVRALGGSSGRGARFELALPIAGPSSS